MTMIKIISNPYKQEIQYQIYKEGVQSWIDVGVEAPNGKLREESARTCFLPFNAKEILEIIIDEYYLENKGAVEIAFEGTKDEYIEMAKVSEEAKFVEKIKLTRSNRLLENGKFILSDTKEVFNNVKPIIEEVIKDETTIQRNLMKVADALDDIIPICVFGNYSAGKSAFINSLLGREVLPSGGDPVTAKAFKIQNSALEDIAKIKFTHWNEQVELSLSDDSYRFVKGNYDCVMLKELKSSLKAIEEPNLDKMVSVALEFINAYEKKDSTSIEIGNMIELSISFQRTGILGRSNNKFVIFDTPGSNTASNTASNDGHIEVLKEALEGFSNGIPVWVSQYEAIDTMDNESLCNNIMSIDALDKRFTMIVLNKADVSDLPEKEFNDEQIKNIKDFRSVEKMYASGIFFVSSIMGLGSKLNGALSDKHYRKIYKLQTSSFSDVEDEDYMELYRYNIMPSQIKEDVIAYSVNEDNKIYVNSGLHCVETEIEEFASKFSAYNKCQMVYALLSDVVEKTTEKIEQRVKARKKLRDKYIGDLEERKQELITTMHVKSAELDKSFSEQSFEAINTYSKNNLDYSYSLEMLKALNDKHFAENSGEYNLDTKKNDYDNAVNQMIDDVVGKVKKLQINHLKESFTELVDETKKGVSAVRSSKKDLENTKKSASAETVDEVLNEVIDTYKNNMVEATKKITHIACNYWENNSMLLREELVHLVTISDALTDVQKHTLSELIFNYKNIVYDDKASSIFVKPKFLQGHLLGIDLFQYEKLNTSKLAKEYNATVDKNIQAIATDMNNNYYNSYKKWQDELSAMIELNIVELNPELQVISDSIINENEKIERLESSQQMVRASLSEIENLISFIEIG